MATAIFEEVLVPKLETLVERAQKLEGDLNDVREQIRDEVAKQKSELDAALKSVGANPGSRRKSGTKLCGNCGQAGHNRRSCPQLKK